MKLKNIFLSALSITNFLVMFKKAYLRFFDTKNSISSQELNSWLDKNATSIEKFCSDLDYNLWQETKKETKKINEYAYSKLREIKFDLGGSAQIELIYFLTRLLKPKIVFETGVAAGFSSASILEALNKNSFGTLYSSDFPYFRLPNPFLFIGVIVPDKIKKRWQLYTRGDKKNIKDIKKIIKEINLFHYDSDKSYLARKKTLASLSNYFSNNCYIVMDDIDDNTFFYDFVNSKDFNHEWKIFKKGKKWVGLIKQNI